MLVKDIQSGELVNGKDAERKKATLKNCKVLVYSTE